MENKSVGIQQVVATPDTSFNPSDILAHARRVRHLNEFLDFIGTTFFMIVLLRNRRPAFTRLPLK
jgi:hypothetical protein